MARLLNVNIFLFFSFWETQYKIWKKYKIHTESLAPFLSDKPSKLRPRKRFLRPPYQDMCSSPHHHLSRRETSARSGSNYSFKHQSSFFLPTPLRLSLGQLVKIYSNPSQQQQLLSSSSYSQLEVAANKCYPIGKKVLHLYCDSYRKSRRRPPMVESRRGSFLRCSWAAAHGRQQISLITFIYSNHAST